MGIFNKKELKEHKREIESLKEAIEKKGYLETQEQNKFFLEFLKNTPQVNLLNFQETNFEDYIKYYKTNAIVRGIVGTTIAQNVGEIAQYIELVDKDEKEVMNHWALNVLDNPNELDNRRSFITGWAVLRLLTGNSFIYKEETVGSKRQPKELYNIPVNEVNIITGGAYAPLKGFDLKNSGGLKATFTANDIIFSRDFNPDIKSFFGLSPLQAAADYVQLIIKGNQRQNAAVENGGVGRLVTPKDGAYGWTPEQTDDMDKKVNKREFANKTKSIALPVDVHELSDKPADLSLLETSEHAINALCFVYGISVDSFLGQAKYNNAKEAKKAVIQQAAIPLLNIFLGDINKAFKKYPDFKDLKLILNTDKIEILRDSPTEFINALVQANASINTKLEHLGYPKIEQPYADLPLIPLGYSLGDPSQFDVNENNPTA